MGSEKIAVIGGGNGGFAMAGDLTLSGLDVNVYELPRFVGNIEAIQEEGGINVTGVAKTGFAKLNKITTDIRECTKDCSIIMVVTQAWAHEEIAGMLASVLKPGQCVFVLPGSGGSLFMGKVFHEKSVSSKVGLAETLTLPYACRKTGPSSVNISRLMASNGVGAFPSKNIDWIFSMFKGIYPSSFKMDNALEVGLCNSNIILHPAATLLSLSRIEFSKGDFYLYREAFTPSIEKVIDALDQELAAIFARLGFPSESAKRAIVKRDQKTWEEQKEVRRKFGNKGPFDAKTRYITEDVPIGMVLVSSIGRWLGIETKTFDSIINLCSVIHGADYRKEGRTLEKLGLGKIDVDTFKRILYEGF